MPGAPTRRSSCAPSVLIPDAYGGSGLGLDAASAIREESHCSGCNGGAYHAQMHMMGTVLRHGSEAQKRAYLPGIASGDLRFQAFGVTEPASGTDTTRIRTFARRDGDHYVVSGQKVWISRAEHSDLMVLLVRTTPREQAKKPTDGMSVLLVDLREAVGNGLTIRPIRTMINHAATELFFDDLRVPAENLIGAEGRGFHCIIDGMNAERILIASECIGDARFFIDRSFAYAVERQVFGRPIGVNQGIQFPIARNHVETEAAALMVRRTIELFDSGRPCGTEANMAKLLASEASWHAADTCLQTHGVFGFSEEYDIERKFRETRLYQIAPISTNLILSHVAPPSTGFWWWRWSRRWPLRSARRALPTPAPASSRSNGPRATSPVATTMSRTARTPISPGSTAARNRWFSTSRIRRMRRCSAA